MWPLFLFDCHKNLGNLTEFLAKWFTPSPPAKNWPYAYDCIPEQKSFQTFFSIFQMCRVVHLAAEIKSYWSLYLYILPHNPVPNIVIESSMIMDWIQYANAFNARYPQQIWVKYIWSIFLLSDYYKMQYTRVLYEAKVNKTYNLITQSSSLFAIKSEINLTGYISSTTFFSQFIKITEKQFLEQCR